VSWCAYAEKCIEDLERRKKFIDKKKADMLRQLVKKREK